MARAIEAAQWNYVGVIIRVGLQFAVQIFLARKIGPEAFGLGSLGFVAISLGMLVVEMGLGSALVQAKSLDNETLDIVATRMLISGLGGTGALWLLSAPVAAMLGYAELEPVLRAMAPMIVLYTVSVVPLSLLRREMNFFNFQLIQLFSYLIGFVLVGCTLAVLGYGVWSLVGAYLAQTLVAGIAPLILMERRPRLKFSGRLPGLQSFGFVIMSTNVLNWSVENLSNVVIGGFFGPKVLGLYTIANNLVRTPANHLVVSLQSVVFPASSLVQDNPEKLRRGYLIAVALVMLVAAPVFVGLAAVSNTVIAALFGDRWQGAGGMLAPLALAMNFHVVMALAGPLLAGAGDPGAELKIQFATLVAFIAMLVITAPISAVALAWGVLVVYALRAILMTAAVAKRVELSGSDQWRVLRGPLLLASLVAVVLWLVDLVEAVAGIAAALRLASEVTTGALIILLSLWLIPRVLIVHEIAWFVVAILARFPLLKRMALLRRFAAGPVDPAW